MAVDGEPFTHPPVVVSLRHFGQISVLANPSAVPS